MGNQESSGLSSDAFKQLSSKYDEVTSTPQGTIYKLKATPNTCQNEEDEFEQFFILKEHSYPTETMMTRVYRNYKEEVAHNKAQEFQSNTLSVREVVKEEAHHFCSNSYKVYTLYEYPELTLKDQIEVRSKEGKFFEEGELISILQTCILALDELKCPISFNTKSIFISPEGIIKVIHKDLCDESYRQIVTEGIYYAPQKIQNFNSESVSEASLRRQMVFSLGMTLLEACLLEDSSQFYDYSLKKVKQSLLSSKIASLSETYSTDLTELIGNMVEMIPNRRISILQIQRAMNEYRNLIENQQKYFEQQNCNSIDRKCDELFQKSDGKAKGHLQQSKEYVQEPSIPNLLSRQNSARISFKNVERNPRFNQNIGKADETCYKVPTIERPIRANQDQQTKQTAFSEHAGVSKQSPPSDLMKMKPLFVEQQNYQSESQRGDQNQFKYYTGSHQKEGNEAIKNQMVTNYDSQGLFTDPKLLEMIKKDLQMISQSRYHQQQNYQPNNNSFLSENPSSTTADVQLSQNNTANQNFQSDQIKYVSGSSKTITIQKSSQEQTEYQRYVNQPQSESRSSKTHFQDCPEVESMNASVAMSPNEKSNNVPKVRYLESDVKCSPNEQTPSPQKSILLSSKNFKIKSPENLTPIPISENQSLRQPLSQISTNNFDNEQQSEDRSQNDQNQRKTQRKDKRIVEVQGCNAKVQIAKHDMTKKLASKTKEHLVYLEETYEDGVRYEGMSLNNLKEGFGKLIYSDGAYYEGHFQNDKIHGKGILYYEEGKPAYDGEWVQDQFQGYGQLYNEEPEELPANEEFPYHNFHFVDNYWVKYEGEFVGDNKHGKGRMVFSNKDEVEGEFKDDMINGWAVFRAYDQGKQIEGRWENNILVEICQE